MDHSNERVSVIVVGYNHRKFLADCVQAFEKSIGKIPARLILVDNNSTDGSADFVRNELMEAGGCNATRGGVPATFIASEKNLGGDEGDRKSTRLNSSHQIISYAVFCLKKKNKSSTNTVTGHPIPRT